LSVGPKLPQQLEYEMMGEKKLFLLLVNMMPELETEGSMSTPDQHHFSERSAPVLLNTKLAAEWIGENLQEALGFPNKANRRASPGTWWTTS
jgi:hypothetical protein